jgi:hypothetical protein
LPKELSFSPMPHMRELRPSRTSISHRPTSAVPIQNLPPNSEMRDHAAIFLRFRDGRIARQHHYDGFEPW